MIEQITPSYKFICDRCGKEVIVNIGDTDPKHDVIFKHTRSMKIFRREGQICEDCAKEFQELAENFFSEVNKENKNDQN